MKLRSSLIFCLLITASIMEAAVTIRSFSYTSFLLEVTTHDPKILLKETPQGTFSEISVPASGRTTEEGKPLLPVVREFVEIPEGASAEVIVRNYQREEIRLDFPVYPLQPPIPKTGPTPSWTKDETFYKEDVFFPEKLASLSSFGYIRAHRICVLEVYPIRYDPQRGIIEYYPYIELEIKTAGGDIEKTFDNLRKWYSLPFEKRLSDLVINFRYYSVDAPPLPIGYLIIVPDEWYNNIMPLAQWRLRKGYKTKVAKLSEVGGGGADVVRNYIVNAYNNWPVRPTYVLLVGDVDRIGYFTGQGSGNPPTDLNFSLMTSGDYFPDIDVSRASVANSAQLDSFVQKVIKYEKNEWITTREWLKKSYFIASSDGGNHQVAESTHKYCMRLQRRYGVICDSLFLYYNSGTPVPEAINGGRAWVTYSGHGNYDRWADNNFTSDNVRALVNVDKVPFVGTYACYSGGFHSSSYPECFSETWIRIGLRGAIGHYASSVTSYWVEDDTFQRRVFDAAMDSNFFWAMGMINKGKLRYFQQMGNNSTTRRYFEMYNLMGDGAIDIYWDLPQAISVSHPQVIPVGSYQLTVTVQRQGQPVVGALVCALAKNDTACHRFAYTNSSGQVTLNLFTQQPDSIYITVSGHNLETYCGACIAVPMNRPYVTHLSHIIDDASPRGNGDGIPNPGEELEIPLWVKNWGNVSAEGVSGKFFTRNGQAHSSDTIKNFGTIPANDSAFTGPNGYNLQINTGLPNGYAIPCSLLCKDSFDSVWVSTITITVGTPVFSYESYIVSDSHASRPNRRIDPGEEVFASIGIKNTGLGHGYNVQAVLRSYDSLFSVRDPLANYGFIHRDSVIFNWVDRFTLYADPRIRPETQVPCTLLITADGGYTKKIGFTIGVGVLTITDPIPDGEPAIYWAYDNIDTFYLQRPVYRWIELRNRGTQLPINSDDQTYRIPLPFVFKYYGQRFAESLSVCGNGWIVPGRTTSAVYTNQPLPDPTSTNPHSMICINWDDLYPPVGNRIWYLYEPDSHRFIIEWDSVHYYSQREVWDKFEIIVYDTTISTPTGDNRIVFQYYSANNYTSNTVGIENNNSTRGICGLYNGSYHRACAPIGPRSAIAFQSGAPQIGILEKEDLAFERSRSSRIFPTILRGGFNLLLSMKEKEGVKITVYDATGREVVRNTDCELPNRWRLPAGIYFIRLEDEGKKRDYKIIVIE